MVFPKKDKYPHFFDGRLHKLKKEKLNQIDTIFDENSYKFMSYYVYCWEDGASEAKEKLTKKLEVELKKRLETTNLLSAAYASGYKFLEMRQYDPRLIQ